MTSMPRETGSTLPGLTPKADNPQSMLPDQLVEFLRLKKLEEDKLKWAGWVEGEYVKAKNARAPFERQWYLNLAFYLGKQYLVPVNIPAQGFRLTSPRVPAHRVRLVINIIRKTVRKECSKLTSSKPIPTVIPATNEDEDQTGAQVSEQLLKTEFSNADFEAKYRRWIFWGVTCGAAYLKSYYDPTKVDYNNMVMPSEDAAKGLPPDIIAQVPGLEEYLNTPQPAKGKIEVVNVTPFQLFVPDLMIEDLQDQPFIMHVTTASAEATSKRYGINAVADARASSSVLDSAGLITKGSEGQLPDSVLIKECWIKPGGHPDFPEGGLITVINSKVAYLEQKWPVPFDEYPFYEYSGIPTGGFYDDSVIVDAIPLQKEYNRKRSQIIEIQNVVGKPKVIYQKGSLDPRKINTEAGQSIPYEMGFDKPQVVPGAEVPVSMVNEVEKLRSELDDLTGQHDISNGQVPSGVTSGTAISYLQEQDDTMLSYHVSGIERAVELLGTHHLKYVVQYWGEDRIIRISGRNQAYESIHWKKSAAKGNTDVKVQAGSALPHSKAAKQAFITEMMQNGFMAPEIGLEILDMGNYEKAMAEYLIDKRQAMRENLKMQSGSDKMFEMLMQPTPDQQPQQDKYGNIIVLDSEPEPTPDNPNGIPQYVPFQPQPPIPVNSWDNNEAHIKWHNMFRKSQEFELLSPIKKQAFELHVQGHQMAMQAAMVNQMGTILQPGMGEQMGPGMPVDNGGQQSGGLPNEAEQETGNPESGGTGVEPPSSFSQSTADMNDNYQRNRSAQARQ